MTEKNGAKERELFKRPWFFSCRNRKKARGTHTINERKGKNTLRDSSEKGPPSRYIKPKRGSFERRGRR